MSDAHDLHVLHDLLGAVRGTPGAPPEAAAELEAEAQRLGAAGGSAAPSLLDGVREALGGALGGGTDHAAKPAAGATGGGAPALDGLLARMEAAMHDSRLSGPARDAVIRAFDPVKAARDAALQAEG